MSQTSAWDGTAQPSHRSQYSGMTRSLPDDFDRTDAQLTERADKALTTVHS
jgi:hypothetical protein